MKADKKTLMAVKHFLECDDNGFKEAVHDRITELNLLNHNEIGNLSFDECGIEWDGEFICVLDEFLDNYNNEIIKLFCNILDSFVDQSMEEYDEFLVDLGYLNEEEV